MQGHLCLVLHAHLPFVRHPEHAHFLEENWLFEAITETYIPLLWTFESWERQNMDFRLTLTLSPTLCSMLLDPLLQRRYARYINGLVELAEKELHRNTWEPGFKPLAEFYHNRLLAVQKYYAAASGNLVQEFRRFQDAGRLEIITTSATHAVLPLLRSHPPSLRAQILTARDHYRSCFGCDPRGIWLPECAYVDGVETVLQEANIRWFIVDTHGLLHAKPKPRFGVFAPVFTENGIAVFGRDVDSAKQVWSRDEGYPGDARYRDFYRDIGFDLDLEYLRPHLPAPPYRSFTGIKYFAISGSGGAKRLYNPSLAREAVDEHASHFLKQRMNQFQQLEEVMERPAVLISPYDAELFGHWWFEGPQFLDLFVRKAYYDQKAFRLTTPAEFLAQHPTHQVAKPGSSTWGEGGYLRVWLNEKNEWILPHLRIAQERMTELANQFAYADGLTLRAIKQAARELLLAQSSDWPFILRTGSSPEYATQRVKSHVLRFTRLYQDIIANHIDPTWLAQIEALDNLFPGIDPAYWQ